MEFEIRKAHLNDISKIELLIKESVQELASNDYSSDQIEGALATAWGVDTQLIEDETYFCVEYDDQIVGCGGWSFRETLFGNDRVEEKNSKVIDNQNGAAKIRAFFVKPSFARKGVGTLIMQACENAAKERGFKRLELMATLPGQRLYTRHGFIASPAIEYSLGQGLFITFVPMNKELSPNVI